MSLEIKDTMPCRKKPFADSYELMQRLAGQKNIRTYQKKISSSEGEDEIIDRPRGLSPLRLKKVNGVAAPISSIPYKSLHKDVEYAKKNDSAIIRGNGSEVFCHVCYFS
jgi:hypothetical protein